MEEVYLNYVCPRCFYTPRECVCERAPWELVCIDRNIQEHIRILNQKGYKTEYCCESHSKYENLYISFYDDYGLGDAVTLPDGFKFNKRGKYIEYLYNRKITDQEFEKQKKEQLAILLEWCIGLPEYHKI